MQKLQNVIGYTRTIEKKDIFNTCDANIFPSVFKSYKIKNEGYKSSNPWTVEKVK